MTNEAYPVVMELVKPPSALDAGGGFTLMVAIQCDAPCDLAKARVVVMEGDKQQHEAALGSLIRFDPQSPDYDPRNGPIERRDQAALSLVAPHAIGSFQWRICLPAQEIDGFTLSPAYCDLTAETQGHRCSLVVWDAPSPVQAGEVVRFKVGGKCSAGCALQGQRLCVSDSDGSLVAEPVLQHAHHDAEGLWWGEGAFGAPVQVGLNQFNVQFAPGDMNGLPHIAGHAEFSVLVTETPAHVVRIAVVDDVTGSGVEAAHVRLGVHRVSTNSEGQAMVAVSSGEQRVFVWKAGFNIPEQTILVNDDIDLTIKASALPPKDPYERWQG